MPMMKDEERQPLLGQQAVQNAAETTREDHGKTSKWTSIFPQIQVTDPRFRFLPLIGCLTVLVNEGEYFFKQIGYFRAVEALYCIEYYHVHDPVVAHLGKAIPENMCKIDSIQKKVATANGIVLLVRMTSAFIGTMIVGYLADMYGRRLPLILHKVGTIIYTVVVASTYLGYPYLPIWVSFCGGLGGLIGANFDLNLAILLAAYNDALTSSTQVATYFFITTSMQYVGQVSFPLLAGKAINMDGKGGTPHVSLFISLGMAAAGLVISVLFFPETMKKSEPPDGPDLSDNGGDGKRKGIKAMIAAKAKSIQEGFQRSVQGVGATNVILLIVAMFLATTAIKAVDWLGLIQYPVIKFGWKYNQSTFAMAIQAVIYIFTYFILLPTYNKLGARYGFSPSSTSLTIMLFQ
ncbi:hypothetical protein DOTSEDRAFT_69931 [Dothistroma septosporum NZE10]|uniref:Major facilitator superfamily (MFS) profile domain-containing protein n=1 Tax=Dothistroma septosporum (strain NZE10 / CBS 128990) TaxID=675120 RepID=N1Q0L3_DOTSN|nr:hypothetical protein DOTSEDRAFT_69931 [Dothistroma septosporum NZE10]